MDLERFDILAAANDSGRGQQDSWTLLIDPAGASVQVARHWRDGRPTPHRQSMRIVTFAEFLRSEIGEGPKTGVVDTPKTTHMAANDP